MTGKAGSTVNWSFTRRKPLLVWYSLPSRGFLCLIFPFRLNSSIFETMPTELIARDWATTAVARFLLHRVTRNVVFWLLFAILPVWLNWDGYGSKANFYTDLLYYLEIAFLGYFNNLVLIPRLMDRGRVAAYFVIVFVLVLFTAYVALFWLTPLVSDYTSRLSRPWMTFYYNLDGYFFLVGSFTGAALLVRLAREKSRSQQLDALQKETKLSFLKAQINPHLLFNTLNMMYSHALDRSPVVPEMMLGLAGTMRYALHEGQAKRVPLPAEVQFLQDYVELQRLRLEDRAQVSFLCDTPTSEFQVAPLLLIVLVENAFKYATSHHVDAIDIRIELRTAGDELYFTVRNNLDLLEAASGPRAQSGIGLGNLQQRLRLIYGSAQQLKTEKTDTTFQAVLVLPLEPYAAPAAAPGTTTKPIPA